MVVVTSYTEGRMASNTAAAGFNVFYSVCSQVVPTLEEAILTSVLKKNFK